MISFMNMDFANRLVLVVLLLVGLSACSGENVGTVTESSTGGSRIEMIPPENIALSRAVDQSKLIIKVTVDKDTADEVEVEMVADRETGLRVGNIALNEGAEHTVTVTWSEIYLDVPLELAVANKPLTVNGGNSGNQELEFISKDFDYGSDEDLDDISNLQERNERTNPRDPNDPAQPLEQVDITVRIFLPDQRILENSELLGSITPVAVVDGNELVLTREVDTWVGQTKVNMNSTPFVSVTFYRGPDRVVTLANSQFSNNAGNGTEFRFETSLFTDSETYDNDMDDLSNLAELLNGSSPLNSNDPVQDPCAVDTFALNCTFDTDEDGKPDSQETKTADTDDDGQPNYLESSLQDNDEDGRNAELDSDDEDPCVPFVTNPACSSQQTDTDLDGKSDAEEGTVDTDGDEIPDFRESAILDEDGDGVFDELDEENANPCIPSATSAACVTSQLDTDLDGKTDIEEGTVDSDGDGEPDFKESAILDEDSDGFFDEEDEDNADPCIPSPTSAACVASETDTDLDGKSDLEEGTGDSDGDGIPDFEESSILDEDGDGTFDEDDIENDNPCEPSTLNPACVLIQTDTDLDGKTDLEEGTVDSDGDEIPDYKESAILDEDEDGFFDEEDPENANPCVPSLTSQACVDSLLDTDLDGETDLEEGTGDSDLDGIPDYMESDILDDDSDTLSNEADIENDNPCVPSELNDACGLVQKDSDDDGKTDLEEGDVDSDLDGIPDYLDSAIKDLDNDGIFDEEDPANGNPCLPFENNPECEALQDE